MTRNKEAAVLAAGEAQIVRCRQLCQRAVALHDRLTCLASNVRTLQRRAWEQLADLKRLNDETGERVAAILAASEQGRIGTVPDGGA